MPTPLCILFGNLQLIIHWAPFFAFLNLTLQYLDLVRLITNPAESILLVQAALYFAAPVLSAVCRRNYSQTVWWAIPGMLCAIVTLSQSWMRDTELNLKELEQLRYQSKGT